MHTSLYHRLRKDTAMILASTICRYLLGLMFAIFGANGLLHFLKLPPPTSALALQFQGAINDSHFMVVVFSLQLIAGLLLLAGRFVPLALIMLAGILTNILLYHMTFAVSHDDGPGRQRTGNRRSLTLVLRRAELPRKLSWLVRASGRSGAAKSSARRATGACSLGETSVITSILSASYA